MGTPVAFHGTLIHSHSLDRLEILEDALLTVDADGVISALEKNVPKDDVARALGAKGANFDVQYLSRGEFLIPGFVDTHNHAPQVSHLSVNFYPPGFAPDSSITLQGFVRSGTMC
jgi:guanine deaminase